MFLKESGFMEYDSNILSTFLCRLVLLAEVGARRGFRGGRGRGEQGALAEDKGEEGAEKEVK